MTHSTITPASQVNRLTTFSTQRIHSHGDNDNTRPIRLSVTECSGKQGEMPSAKCQCVTWILEGARGDCSRALIYVRKYDNVKIRLRAIGRMVANVWVFIFKFLTLNMFNTLVNNSLRESDHS